MGRVSTAAVLAAFRLPLSLAGYGALFAAAIVLAVASGAWAPINPQRELALRRLARVTMMVFSVAYCGLALIATLLPPIPSWIMQAVHGLVPDTDGWAMPWRLLFFGPLAMDVTRGGSYAWQVAGALSVPIAFAAGRAMSGPGSFEPPAGTSRPALMALLLVGLLVVALGCGLFLLTTGMMFFGGTGDAFGLIMIWICGALTSFALATIAELVTYAMAVFRGL